MSRSMTKQHVRPAKTQISLGIHSLIRVFADHTKKPRVLSYPLSAQWRLWSDWADAQADLSLHWAHMPFCWFCHEAAHMPCELLFNRQPHLRIEITNLTHSCTVSHKWDLGKQCRARWDSAEQDTWAASWQNQQNDCAPSEDSDQPEHLPSLIRVFAMRSLGT